MPPGAEATYCWNFGLEMFTLRNFSSRGFCRMRESDVVSTSTASARPVSRCAHSCTRCSGVRPLGIAAGGGRAAACDARLAAARAAAARASAAAAADGTGAARGAAAVGMLANAARAAAAAGWRGGAAAGRPAGCRSVPNWSCCSSSI